MDTCATQTIKSCGCNLAKDAEVIAWRGGVHQDACAWICKHGIIYDDRVARNFDQYELPFEGEQP